MKMHLGLLVLLGYVIGFFVLSKIAHADGWNGYPVAFTFSSDDGDSVPNMQWAKVLTDRGLSYTAFIVSDWVNDPAKLTTADLNFLHAQGIEIASHSKTHDSLTTFSSTDSVLDELVLSAGALEGFINASPPYRCRSFAYPYHLHNPREMALASLVGYTAARNGGQNDNYTWPFVSEGEATWSNTDLFEVFCGVEPGFFMRSAPGSTLYSMSETIARVDTLMLGYGPDSSWINVSAHYLSDIDSMHLGWVLDELKRRGDVWIANFSTVADYYRQEHGLPVPTMVQLPVGGTPPESKVLPLRAAPNPIRSRTVLSFMLDEPGPVRLEILGIDGRHVATLISGERGSGPQAVSWRGEDELGHKVAAGVYIARLQTGSLERSQRLILLP